MQTIILLVLRWNVTWTHFLEIEPITFSHVLQPEQKHFRKTLTCIIFYFSNQRSHPPADPWTTATEEISHALNPDSRMTRYTGAERSQASETALSQPYIRNNQRAGSEETFAQAFSKKTQKSLSETLFGFKRAQKLWIQHYGGSELQDGGLKLRTCSLLFLFLIPPVCTLCFSFDPPVSLSLSLAFYFHHRAVLMVSVRATDWVHVCVCVCGGRDCLCICRELKAQLTRDHTLINTRSFQGRERKRCWERAVCQSDEDKSMKGNRI